MCPELGPKWWRPSPTHTVDSSSHVILRIIHRNIPQVWIEFSHSVCKAFHPGDEFVHTLLQSYVMNLKSGFVFLRLSFCYPTQFNAFSCGIITVGFRAVRVAPLCGLVGGLSPSITSLSRERRSSHETHIHLLSAAGSFCTHV